MSTPTKEIIANTCITGDLVVSGSITGGSTGSAFTTDITTTSTTDSTGATDNAGALQVDGGGAIAKKLYVGTDTNLATASGITTIGSTTALTVSAAGVLHVDNATTSTTVSSGALIVDGGAGVAENLNVGGLISLINSDNDMRINGAFAGTGNISLGNSFSGRDFGAHLGVQNNIAIGNAALAGGMQGTGMVLETKYNTCIGGNSGFEITAGVGNTCFGAFAGKDITTGTYNTSIGYLAGTSATLTNTIALGNTATCTVSNECVIGNAALTRIIPGDDNGVDLGASGVAFKDLHLAGIATLGATTAATVSAAGIVDVPNTTETLDTASKNVTTAANGAINTQGDIQLYSSTGSCVRWSPEGVAAPSTSEHSIGSKLILFPKDNTQYDYAIGVEEHYVWISSPTGGLRVYSGGAQILQVDSSGNLNVGGDLAVTGDLTTFAKFRLTTGTKATFGTSAVLVGASGQTWSEIIDNTSTFSLGTTAGEIQVGTAGTYMISFSVQVKQDTAIQRFVDCHFYIDEVLTESITDSLEFNASGQWTNITASFIATFTAAQDCSIRIKQATSDTSTIERSFISFVKI